MSDTLHIDCGGFRTVIRSDVDTAGNRCYVGEHPDLPGIIGYGATPQIAADRLSLARAAALAVAWRRA